MFENLSDRLQGIFSGLKSKGRLTEDDINAAMREIRMALLEADVNFKVVKSFIANAKERCLTAEVLDSLTPAQNVVKIVLDELTALLGQTDSGLVLSSCGRSAANARRRDGRESLPRRRPRPGENRERGRSFRHR